MFGPMMKCCTEMGRFSKDFKREVWVCVDCKKTHSLRDEKISGAKFGRILKINRRWAMHQLTPDVTKKRMAYLDNFWARYQRFEHYCREVAPQWKEIEQIYYADNSTVSHQVNKHGKHREVTLIGPGGDACY